jgi:hypothetical protein
VNSSRCTEAPYRADGCGADGMPSRTLWGSLPGRASINAPGVALIPVAKGHI